MITSEYGAEVSESDGVNFKNIHIFPSTGPALLLKNVKNFELNDFYFPDTLMQVVKIEGKTENIKLPLNIDKNKIVGL